MKTFDPVFQRRSFLIVASAVLLASCGAGLGNDEVASGRGSDTLTLRETSAMSRADPQFNASYLPLRPVGATWIFDVLDSSGASMGSFTRTIVSADSNSAQFSNTDPNGTVSSVDYSMQGGGLVWSLNLNALNKSFPLQLRLYAIPSYGQGQTRVVSGSLTTDVNGDGTKDTLSYEFKQTLVAFNDVAQLPAETVHFQNSFTTRLEQSNTQGPTTTSGSQTMEEVWLAPGLGPVAIERKVFNLLGNQIDFTQYKLISAQVGPNRF